MSDGKRVQLVSVNEDENKNESDEKTSDESNHIVLKAERFHLKLTESTEDSYPEFNIADLMHARLRKSNGINGFSDSEDSDVKRLAKEFEKKYGPNSSNFYYGKKSNWKNDDYADIGAGYDESDSFIDNTEAYDEIIPENVTTFYGGFYVNYGPLEFKQLNSGNKSSRKRLISDSDSSDVEASKKRNNTTVAKKSRLKNDETKSVQKKVETKKSNNAKNSNNVKQTKTEKIKDIEIISTDGSSPESLSESSEENRFSTTTIDSDCSQEADLNDEVNSLKLPKDLKKSVFELLSHKKEINKQSEDAKKYQIIDKHLLLIYEQSYSLSTDNRNKLFDKISNWLKIPKIDMSKYSKKSTVSSESDKLTEIISKLKEQINEIMPKCELQYNTEFNRSLNLVDFGEKNVKQPKRKFLWTVHITKLLNEIVEIKRKEYNLCKNQKETSFYSYVITYFKTEIVNLWPKGWMGINVIIKHCKNLSDSSIKQNCPPSSTITSSSNNKSQSNVSTAVNIKTDVNESSSSKPQQLGTITIPSSTEVTNVSTPMKYRSVIVSSPAVTKSKSPSLPSPISSTINIINNTSANNTAIVRTGGNHNYSKPAANASFVKIRPCTTIIRTGALTAATATATTTSVTSVSKKPMEIFPVTSTPISKQPKSFLPRISIEIQPSIVNSTTTSTPVAKLVSASSTPSCSSNTLQISSTNNLPQTSPLDCRLKREASTLDLNVKREAVNILMNSSGNKKLKIINKTGVNNNNKYGMEVPYVPSTCQSNRISHSSQHNYHMKPQTTSTNNKNINLRNEPSVNLNDDFQQLMNNLKELEQMQMSTTTPIATSSSSRLHKPMSTVTATTTTTTTPTNKHSLLNEQSHQHSNQYSVININHNSSFPDLFLQGTSKQSTNSRASNQKVICSSTNYMVNHNDSSSVNNQNMYATAFLAQKNTNKNSSSFIISNLLSSTQSKPRD